MLPSSWSFTYRTVAFSIWLTRPTPSQILGLTDAESAWLRANPLPRGANALRPLPHAARADMACSLCRAAVDQMNATDAEAGAYMGSSTAGRTTTTTFLCGFHFCWLARARTDAHFRLLSRMALVDPRTGGIRSPDPAAIDLCLRRARLLTSSEPEDGGTATTATARARANAGWFGNIGDGRPRRGQTERGDGDGNGNGNEYQGDVEEDACDTEVGNNEH
ncbi:uncharacterized protein F4812DRAFT_129688 [Daldinia caldariorum]|uniref:uncharacterized protein n=1 Tax=Daldinia caldariorum TaxID=326644 RepID=UPI002008350D|nr:uncharacterized protein F4812DRAFT_129688 [Daldinia caldariorum]KAI1465055.1 hypothetical protein F4812DRAFT_129688 [Daldinia caldariorum]